MPKKYLGFNCQQYGDLVINTVAARSLKERYPDCHLTLCISADYGDISPLFIGHKYIDSVHVLNKARDGFDDVDNQWIAKSDFDKVFSPMPGHVGHQWYENWHQSQEVCRMHKLPVPADYQCNLNKWFIPKFHSKTVAFMPFGGNYNPNSPKKLDLPKCESVVKLLKRLGYYTLQIGRRDEEHIKGAFKYKTSFFDSVVNMLGCDFLITTDSALSWVASAYDFPTIGLYNLGIYKDNIKNIQPINRNAVYIAADNINLISDDDMVTAINKLLK